VDKRGSRSF
jgi:hypothetical protein